MALRERFAQKLGEAESSGSVEAYLALADWCRDQQLVSERRTALERVLALEPNHATARERLAHEPQAAPAPSIASPPPSLSATIASVAPAWPRCVRRHSPNLEDRLLHLAGTGFPTGVHGLQMRNAASGDLSNVFAQEVEWESATRVTLDVGRVRDLLWHERLLRLKVRIVDGHSRPISDWSPLFVVAEQAADCGAGQTATPAGGSAREHLDVGIYALTFNPTVEGRRLSESRGWNDPERLTAALVTELSEATGGGVSVHLTRHPVIRGFPPKVRAYVFTADDYLACLRDPESALHCRQEVDFPSLLNTAWEAGRPSPCEALGAGEVGEVWLWGGPWFDFGEGGIPFAPVGLVWPHGAGDTPSRRR